MDDGQKAGERQPGPFRPFFDRAPGDQAAFAGFQAADVGQEGESHHGRSFGAYLPRLSVGRLCPGEEQVVRPGCTGRRRKRPGRGPGIAPCKEPVADKDALVCTERQRLPQGDFRLWGAHREDRHACALLRAQRECQLQGVLVQRVDDGSHPFPDQGASFLVHPDFVRVRDLLDEHCDLQFDHLGFKWGCRLRQESDP